jgi:flavin reductase (DIM6/NTAB) family NADH-FMN oxidoreductase RutF
MYYETDKNDHGLRYNPLKACVVPRPIGWITTINPAGVVNLAPFSFFNVLSYDRPFVLFSAGVHGSTSASVLLRSGSRSPARELIDPARPSRLPALLGRLLIKRVW